MRTYTHSPTGEQQSALSIFPYLIRATAGPPDQLFAQLVFVASAHAQSCARFSTHSADADEDEGPDWFLIE